MIILKKSLTSEQICFLCVFRIVFICFCNSVWIYYFHLLDTCSQKQCEGETELRFSLGMSCGAAVQGQLCPRLVGSRVSTPTPLGNTALVLCSSSPLQNTSLEICNRALIHLTCIGSQLNQLSLLLSVLATKEKCSLFFIAIFSYSWGLSSCSLWVSSVLYKTQLDPTTFLPLSLLGLVACL